MTRERLPSRAGVGHLLLPMVNVAYAVAVLIGQPLLPEGHSFKILTGFDLAKL